jgi:molybdopterin synthase catalytic subunit
MSAEHVTIDKLIARVKGHDRVSDVGMILCHNGIVRKSDRSGVKKVRSLKVKVDSGVVEEIRKWAESQPGIIAVEIEALEGEFHVGDDLMFVVVAGDVRENVFAAMVETVERMKSRAVKKTEIYEE